MFLLSNSRLAMSDKTFLFLFSQLSMILHLSLELVLYSISWGHPPQSLKKNLMFFLFQSFFLTHFLLFHVLQDNLVKREQLVCLFSIGEFQVARIWKKPDGKSGLECLAAWQRGRSHWLCAVWLAEWSCALWALW